ncbi:MAG: indole-3-glycerol phosphate synthase TrpC [Cytophagales bacterium]|nr:indole-3-glycerol phosphate synthase TrpC [Cytophagales bacterium]MCE2895464.1 indole-3-glycerol phosphate synthase TrpC [Flammeovirgaceae bacterium]MCA6367393.1 indole-3-glycerol phosphate synthase TrpC [Cytophagales bacterium]MCA6371382.1 indole-3-glycerol phosphate synthase TrpC [Cytophagales bacterium]MCA6377529.1 indole-3-glycerol phosphate synthase TrpC [Cytophagales bacterium]
MNILDKIIAHKHKEVAERKSLYPVKLLEQSIFFSSPTVSLKKYVQRKDKSGIIAEIKRKSPSKGTINSNVSIERTSIGYMQAGASALSILTDKEFFGGSSDDLTMARKFNFCPILRKDFIVDEYQIVEAKSIGADAILLIAAALPVKRLNELALFAKSLGLEILMEVHTAEELTSNHEAEVDLVGVNNRDLKTFVVSLEISKKLAPFMPKEKVLISESGIDSPAAIVELRKHGYEGFLMGETFMKHSRPEQAAKDFIEELNQLTK